MQQDPTECSRIERKLVPARAHARGKEIPAFAGMTGVGAGMTAVPFSRHGLRPGRSGLLELPSPSRHANRSNGIPGAKPLTEFFSCIRMEYRLV